MSIVKALDVFEDRQAHLGRGFKAIPGQQLTFQAGKEALRHGVVEAVSNRSHRGSYAHLAAAVSKRKRGVLRALVRVVDHPFRTALRVSHFEGLQNQLRAQVLLHRPPDIRRLKASSTIARYNVALQVGR